MNAAGWSEGTLSAETSKIRVGAKIGEQPAMMDGSKTSSRIAQLLLLLLAIASAFEGGGKKRIDYCLF